MVGARYSRFPGSSRKIRIRAVRLFACALVAGVHPTIVAAATTNMLPTWICAHPDAIFIDGFQSASAITRLPSNGSGGTTGNVSRTVSVAAYGSHTVYLHVPASYAPTHPMPLVLALHGQAGSPAQADTAAQAVRNSWSTIADANGFIAIAPVATGGAGGWIAPPPNPSD